MKPIHLFRGLAISLFLLVLSGCVSTESMIYMQGVESLPASTHQDIADFQLRVQPDDQLAISIQSRDEELILPFANYLQIGAGAGPNTSTVSTQTGAAFMQVDKGGYIHFPILGNLQVAGLTFTEVSSLIEGLLKSGNYVKDPSVKVKLMSFRVTVLGEVKNPGVQSLSNERVTLLEALGRAGDLLPSGRRENVLVMRDIDGQKTSYRIDLTNARSVMESPGYYLKQNDVIYVTPNNSIKVKGSSATTYISLFSSVLGVVASLTSLVLVIVKL